MIRDKSQLTDKATGVGGAGGDTVADGRRWGGGGGGGNSRDFMRRKSPFPRFFGARGSTASYDVIKYPVCGWRGEEEEGIY